MTKALASSVSSSPVAPMRQRGADSPCIPPPVRKVAREENNPSVQTVIRRMQDAFRAAEMELPPDFAAQMRNARNEDERDSIVMEQVQRIVRAVRDEERAKKNASDSRDG